MAGRSVHITTPLPERIAITSPVTDELAKGRRMGIEITLNTYTDQYLSQLFHLQLSASCVHLSVFY